MGVNLSVHHSQSSEKPYQASRMHLPQQCQALGRKPTPSGQRGWHWQHSHGRLALYCGLQPAHIGYLAASPKAGYCQPEGWPQACSQEGSGPEPQSAKGHPGSPAELTSVGCAGTPGSPAAAAERAGPPVL